MTKTTKPGLPSPPTRLQSPHNKTQQDRKQSALNQPKGENDSQTPTDQEQSQIEKDDLISLVCNLLCRGLRPAQIATEVTTQTGKKVSREAVSKWIAEAGKRELIHFEGPRSGQLEAKLKDSYGFLERRFVVRTCMSEDISNQVAQLLFELVKSHHKPVIHMGIAGGRVLRRACKRFAAMLQETADWLPQEIVLHSLVAGWSDDPTLDPNSFFQFFHPDNNLRSVKVRFVGLHAPGFVPTGEYDELKSYAIIKEAYDQAGEIDIVLTSAGGHWTERHSMLSKMFGRIQPDSLEQLEKLGVIGDLIWTPFSKTSLNLPTEYRTMTLFELNDLRTLVAHGKKVLLAIAPCGECGQHKGEILQAILEHSKREEFITHLVADHRSVRYIV